MNVFVQALQKITDILHTENIDYMLVGGFAVSYHNRARTTNDIDIVLQIYPAHVARILKYFPEWKAYEESFKSSVQFGQLFNITDFESGIRYDFISFTDSDYNWKAFERRERVDFYGITCYICSKEDLVISKLQWYNITQSSKQKEDIFFLLLDTSLNMSYIKSWVNHLKLNTYGFLEY